jgi:heterodisulfide reductase subunit C
MKGLYAGETMAEQKALMRQKIKEMSDEDVAECYQCGLCSAACLMRKETDLSAHMAIRYAQMGRKDVLETKGVWLCLSCSTCRIKCPKQIDLGKVMDVLRQLSLTEGVTKYAAYCDSCGQLFLTTPILDYLKQQLNVKNREVRNEILNLCPVCKRGHVAKILRQRIPR